MSTTPESPGWQAYKIVSGGGSIEEKMVQLKQLSDQHPGVEEVHGYFESLKMQQLLEENRG